jgi:hypothetical protein
MADIHNFPLVAFEPIKPSTVIKLHVGGPGQDFSASPCGLLGIPFGIAQNWTEGAPGTPFDTGYAASAGIAIKVWAPGATAVAAVKKEAGDEFSGIMVGANADSEIVFVSTGWAVGYLLESGVDGKRTRHRIFVHPVCLCSAQASQS